ncbi:hypothetical protein [Actimicrobium sp. CCI2.3]|uniref:hypothetical protein n=1 Tax=Actimicrobium sp. CCI2.3 TaxID=3048616 RepID=UPI003A10364F
MMASALTLMILKVSVPDHTTVSRRSVGLPIMKSASVPDVWWWSFPPIEVSAQIRSLQLRQSVKA